MFGGAAHGTASEGARRAPAAAGYFYPANPGELRALVASLCGEAAIRRNAVAIIVPHAGYQYSGRTAGMVFSRVIIPERVILVGPNHRSLGPAVCVYPRGAWQTPLGRVMVDAETTAALVTDLPGAVADAIPHEEEHSLEVQLAFLQFHCPDLRGAFVILGDVALNEVQAVGDGLAKVIREHCPSALLLASTDLSHYLPEEEARRRDARAIEAMCALDEAALYERVENEGISMCGYMAAAVVIRAAKALGATTATLVDYRTSAEASGDTSAVVGYAGIVLQ
jgi:AmmeMemoRadiSam system protein B